MQQLKFVQSKISANQSKAKVYLTTIQSNRARGKEKESHRFSAYLYHKNNSNTYRRTLRWAKFAQLDIIG